MSQTTIDSNRADSRVKSLRTENASPEKSVAPVRRQYLQIKSRFPDTILFFRLGDFYETFEQDAEIAARVLNITLTSRDLGKGTRVALAGIPHHAAENYIAKLVQAGHKVAICEQMGSAEKGRALIERDVTRVVTPGTVTEPSMLDTGRNTYIAAVVLAGPRAGLAYADLSTGEFATTQIATTSDSEAADWASREIMRLGAVETVLPSSLQSSSSEPGASWLPAATTPSITDDWQWQLDHATERLFLHFGVETLDGFGLGQRDLAVRAAGGLLAFLQETQRFRLAQLTELHSYSAEGSMVLDAQARRNLELIETTRGEKRHSLVATLDATRTPMGARLLRRWINQPLLDCDQIRERQDAIQGFVDDPIARSEVRQTISRIGDIERWANRALMNAISPRELFTLRRSLDSLDALLASGLTTPESAVFGQHEAACARIRMLLARAIPDDPPSLGNGEAILAGFSAELDDHERRVREAREWIAGLERRERERTGLRALKVGFNRVSGYYIEITANALGSRDGHDSPGNGLPPEYLLRQSLANATRFSTPELKEHEARVLSAQETLAHIEASVFQQVVAEVASQTRALCAIAAAVATVDVTSALADIAVARHYVRPIVDDSLTIDIVEGRHPTLEQILPPGEFIANDSLLDDADHRITILTGPNMAGKSSWLRQTALLVLMAQIGSFVPAASARIGLVDRIFTRIGAQDDISSGQSTFMVEMLETASILHGATERSLVLLDEIGRGTSTWDGLAIARAVIEYIHNAPRLGCRTLFATHFHELTDLADILPGVCCARMEVLEDGDRVVFLHRVAQGSIDRSYGIHVAELAGIPRALTRRAREILAELEGTTAPAVTQRRRGAMSRPAPEKSSMQLTLFAPPSPVVEAIRALDVESLTPLEALTKLYELHNLARADSGHDR